MTHKHPIGWPAIASFFSEFPAIQKNSSQEMEGMKKNSSEESKNIPSIFGSRHNHFFLFATIQIKFS